MSIKELRSQSEIDKFIRDNDKALIFYGTRSCGHCVNAGPTFMSLASRFPNVKFAHVEVSEVKLNEMFRGYPAFGFYTNGQRDMLFGAPKLEETVIRVFGNDISRNPRILNSAITKAYSPRHNVAREVPKAVISAPRSPRRVTREVQVVSPRSPRRTVTREVEVVIPQSRVVRSNVRANPRI